MSKLQNSPKIGQPAPNRLVVSMLSVFWTCNKTNVSLSLCLAGPSIVFKHQQEAANVWQWYDLTAPIKISPFLLLHKPTWKPNQNPCLLSRQTLSGFFSQCCAPSWWLQSHQLLAWAIFHAFLRFRTKKELLLLFNSLLLMVSSIASFLLILPALSSRSSPRSSLISLLYFVLHFFWILEIC